MASFSSETLCTRFLHAVFRCLFGKIPFSDRESSARSVSIVGRSLVKDTAANY